MKALEIKRWPVTLHQDEWPKGVLEQMDASVIEALFELRKLANVPMTPSSLADAHVRQDGNSMHSTKGGTRLASATDIHVKTYENLMKVMSVVEKIPAITGFGVYFDTNTPLFHIDTLREQPLMWVAFKGAKGKREYLYRENNPHAFYKKLGELLCSR